MKKMLRWLWFFVSVGCFVLMAILVPTKAPLPVLLFFFILSVLFMAAAIGGRKGVAVGAGILVFIACIRSFAWLATQAPSFKAQGYSEPVIFFGVILGLGISFFLPFRIGGWLLPKTPKQAGEEKGGRKEKTDKRKEIDRIP